MSAQVANVWFLVRVVRDQTLAILRVGGETLYYVVRAPWDGAVILRQMFEVGNRSLFFTLLTLGFLGAIITLQAGFQAKRVIGDTTLIGAQTLPLLVRQLGPTLTGLMVSTRVGTGIAAEIGSMVVTEQVDALRMCNAPPADYLIKPRFLACLVMIPVLTVIGIASAFTAGMLTAWTLFDTNPAIYAKTDLVTLIDVGEGIAKAFAYGLVIPIVAGAAGMEARGGSEGVGSATTIAVVNTSLAVIVLDFLIGGAAFLVRV